MEQITPASSVLDPTVDFSPVLDPTVDLSPFMGGGYECGRKKVIVPTVDLSPFMDGGDKSRRKKVMETISEACTNLGVFYIKNHGVSLDHCEKFLKLTKTFFSYSEEKKKRSTEEDKKISGAGYDKMDDKYHDFEYLLMYSPGVPHNGVPTFQHDPHTGVPTIEHDFRETFEELFKSLVKAAQILEEIINDCLGLPPNFLKRYNNDRREDFMIPLHYTRANRTKHVGIVRHQDPQFITITLQDDVSGLQVYENGNWITTPPTKGKLVVVVDDLVQVLSNKKYRHVTHRALKNKQNNRFAIDFCYTFAHNKWIEPLRLHPEEMGVKPEYRGFMFKEYTDMVWDNYMHPPPTIEDFVDITYYEI